MFAIEGKRLSIDSGLGDSVFHPFLYGRLPP